MYCINGDRWPCVCTETVLNSYRRDIMCFLQDAGQGGGVHWPCHAEGDHHSSPSIRQTLADKLYYEVPCCGRGEVQSLHLLHTQKLLSNLGYDMNRILLFTMYLYCSRGCQHLDLRHHLLQPRKPCHHTIPLRFRVGSVPRCVQELCWKLLIHPGGHWKLHEKYLGAFLKSFAIPTIARNLIVFNH